jgi:hypothetical protein
MSKRGDEGGGRASRTHGSRVGQAGRGGGASLALLSVDATVALRQCILHSAARGALRAGGVHGLCRRHRARPLLPRNIMLLLFPMWSQLGRRTRWRAQTTWRLTDASYNDDVAQRSASPIPRRSGSVRNPRTVEADGHAAGKPDSGERVGRASRTSKRPRQIKRRLPALSRNVTGGSLQLGDQIEQLGQPWPYAAILTSSFEILLFPLRAPTLYVAQEPPFVALGLESLAVPDDQILVTVHAFSRSEPGR